MSAVSSTNADHIKENLVTSTTMADRTCIAQNADAMSKLSLGLPPGLCASLGRATSAQSTTLKALLPWRGGGTASLHHQSMAAVFVPQLH